VFTVLRIAKNRAYLYVGVYLLAMSLVFASISAICTMPLSWRTHVSASVSADCIALDEHAQHAGHEPAKDCSFKPCFESQPHPVFASKYDQPEFAAVMLCFWLLAFLFARSQPQRIPRIVSPPDGRRIPLIYRFCTLLN
jgi:hypothetical protein